MANQEITVTGNIGKTPVFKSGEHNLVEIFLIAEETRRDDDGQLQTIEGSTNAYPITVWGNSENAASLEHLKALQKGMRITVTGGFRPQLWTDEASGEVKPSYGINCRPSDVSLKLNRIESITMKPKREQATAPTVPQQQTYGDDYPPSE
jgi:single-stranded DNA-binding protein